MATSKKGDSIWIVIVGIVFILLIATILLVPKSYFNMEKFIDAPIGTDSMISYLTTGVGINEFEKKFTNSFITPDTIPFTFSNGNELLIGRRCYQFTDFGCNYEPDTNKKAACKKFRSEWLSKPEVTRYGFDKIDYSMSSVMKYFDNIAAGQSPFNMLCRTYRLFTDNANDINDTVINDIKNQYNILQKPLEGGVHVLVVQAPFHRNFSGEFLSVNYTTSTTQPYFDNFDEKTQKKKYNPTLEGKIVTYVVIIYGLYQKDGNGMNNYDVFDGTGAKPTDDYLMKNLDMYYSSKEDTCKLNCPNRSDMYCGCGSTPVVPGYIGDSSKGDRAYVGMLLEIPSTQRSVTSNSQNTFTSNYNTLYKPSITNNIISDLPNIVSGTSPVYPYQSKCVGPSYPLAMQNDNTKNNINATTLSTYAILYRVNPKATMNKKLFKVMDDNYRDLPNIK